MADICCPAHAGLFRTSARGRRGFVAAALAGATLAALPRAARAQGSGLNPDQALEKLREGNRRYLAIASGQAPALTAQRTAVAQGQSPYCVILGCADSRVPPEHLFSGGLGELFVIRNAGNTADTAAIGSIEYGVGVLGAPLLVVLGHERCGAVDAAAKIVANNATYPGSIGDMIEPIVPAVLAARGMPGDALQNAIAMNARRSVERIRRHSTIIQQAEAAGKLKLVAATYDLDDGAVTFLA